MVAALTSGTPEAAELKALLAREDELSEDDLLHAADLIVAAGGKAWAEKEADDRLAAAAAIPRRHRRPGRRPGRVHRHRRVHHRPPVVVGEGSGRADAMTTAVRRAPTRGT